MYEGRASIVLRPGTTEEVSQILALAHEHAIPVVPQAGNTGLVGGQIADAGRDPAVGRPAKRVRARRPAGLHHDGGGRPDAGRGAGRGRQRRPAVPAEPAVGGQLPDRRQPRHQRRRRRACWPTATRASWCSASRWCWPTGASGTASRRLKKDNTGYDLKDLFIGSEGTLGRHHGRGAEAVPQARREGHRLRGAARPRRGAALFGLAQETAGHEPHGLRGHGRHRARHWS